MRELTRPTTEPTIWMLVTHHRVYNSDPSPSSDTALRRVTPTNAPLFITRIQRNLQDTEALQRPKDQPRLRRILAHVLGREPLDQRSGEELDMLILLKLRFAFCCLSWGVGCEYPFGGCLKFRCRCWVRVVWHWTHGGYDSSQ